MPRVRMRCDDRVVWRRVRETLQALRPAWEAMDTTRLNLILSTPLIPKENVLLIEGIHDLVLGSTSDRRALAKVAAVGNLAIALRSPEWTAGLDRSHPSLAGP